MFEVLDSTRVLDFRRRFLARIVFLLGRYTIFGRGKSRKQLIKFLQNLGVRNVRCQFRRVPYIFSLDNTTERQALFGKYDNRELDFILDGLEQPNSNKHLFVDIGANSGFYTQYVAARSKHNTQIIAVEPNPMMVDRILSNIALLGNIKDLINHRIVIERCAISEKAEECYLNLEDGPGKAHLMKSKGANSIQIQSDTLAEILSRNSVQLISALKIDVEGFEDVALVPFLSCADPSLLPKRIVIEHSHQKKWTINVLELLYSKGYTQTAKTRGNTLLILK